MANKSGKSIFKRLQRYLIAGFLVTAPAFISIYVIVWLLGFTDRWAKSLLPERWYNETQILGIPGIGLVILLALLIVIGFFASSWLGNLFVRITDKLFTGTPVFSSLYTTLKQLLHTLLGDNTMSFRQVVYVEFPRKGLWSIGFVTGMCEDDNPALPKDAICVFVPTTPNPTSGYLILVGRDQLVNAAISVEQALKMVVSLGMTKAVNTVAKEAAAASPVDAAGASSVPPAVSASPASPQEQPTGTPDSNSIE